MDFPTNPSVGDIYTDEGSNSVFRWDGSRWMSMVQATAAENIYYDSAASGLGADEVQTAIDTLAGVTDPGGNVTSRPIHNFLINPSFEIAQRGTSFTVTEAEVAEVTLDRWEVVITDGAVVEVDVDQVQLAPFQALGANHQVELTPNVASPTPGALSMAEFGQRVEDLYISSLAPGTSGAKEVTIRFEVEASKPGKLGITLRNSAGRYYCTSVDIVDPDTVETHSLVVKMDIDGGAYPAYDSSEGLSLWFGLCVGDGRTGAQAGVWHTPTGVADYVTGVTNFMSDAADFVRLSDVQIAEGNNATTIVRRSRGVEEDLCERYMLTYDGNKAFIGHGYAKSTTQFSIAAHTPVEMRATPTVEQKANFRVTSTGGVETITDVSVASGLQSMEIEGDGVGFTVGLHATADASGGPVQLNSEYTKTGGTPPIVPTYPNGYDNRTYFKAASDLIDRPTTNRISNYIWWLDWTDDRFKSKLNGGNVDNTSTWPDFQVEDRNDTVLPYDLVAYDPVAGRVRMFIRQDVSNEEGFYLYYDKILASDPADAAGCWGDPFLLLALQPDDGTDRSGKNQAAVSVVSAPAASGTLLTDEAGDAAADMEYAIDATLLDGISQVTVVGMIETTTLADRSGFWVASGADNTARDRFQLRQQVDTNPSGNPNTFHASVIGNYTDAAANANSVGNHHIAMSWQENQHPRIYVDGVRSESVLFPSTPKIGQMSFTAGDKLRFGQGHEGLSGGDGNDWTGLLDLQRIYTRVLPADHIAAEHANRTDLGNFLEIGVEEAALPALPDDPEPPVVSLTRWDEFINDDNIPAAPSVSAQNTIQVSTVGQFHNAMNAARQAVGSTTKIELTGDIVGTLDATYDWEPGARLYLKFGAFKIEPTTYDGDGNPVRDEQFRFRIQGQWSSGVQVSDVTYNSDGLPVLHFAGGFPPGTAVGEVLKTFVPRTDSTYDPTRGALVYSRTPASNRLGFHGEVLEMTATTVTLADPDYDYGDHNGQAARGGYMRCCRMLNRPGELYIEQPEYQYKDVQGWMYIRSMVGTTIVRPVVDQRLVGDGYQAQIVFDGCYQQKIFSPQMRDESGDAGLGFQYGIHSASASRMTAVVHGNGDPAISPHFRNFRHNVDTGSATLQSNQSDAYYAQYAGPNIEVGSKNIIHGWAPHSCTGPHSKCAGFRSIGDIYDPLESRKPNFFIADRGFDSVHEGLELWCSDFAAALFQFFNEAGESRYLYGWGGGPNNDGQSYPGANSYSYDNGCFNIYLRRNIFHLDAGADFYYLSGGWRGPIHMEENTVRLEAAKFRAAFWADGGRSPADSSYAQDVLPGLRQWRSESNTYLSTGNYNNTIYETANQSDILVTDDVIDLSSQTSGTVTLAVKGSGTNISGNCTVNDPNGVLDEGDAANLAITYI